MTHRPFTPRETELILERDNQQCVRCQSTKNISPVLKVPWDQGGTRSARNIHTLCKPCQEEQGDLTWWEFMGYEPDIPETLKQLMLGLMVAVVDLALRDLND